jgi:nucleoside-diphosphate-sugar epimerase
MRAPRKEKVEAVKLLLVGGSGGVGTAVTPYLRRRHELRVLDVRPPSDRGVEYIQGSITEPDILAAALDGCDAFINLVMKDPGPNSGTATDQSVELIQAQYAVNTLGLHLLLYTAHQMGLRSGVHTSTMTVHNRNRDFYWQEEGVPRDAPGVYGLTKGLGEQICEYFARYFDMNLIALRITGPRSRGDYLDARRSRQANYRGPLFVTDEEDLANAYLAALDSTRAGHGRFDAFFIAGDEEGRAHNLSKAGRVLGWEPQSQRLLDPDLASNAGNAQ